MGYYYDWVNEQWVEKPLVKPRPPSRVIPRRTLVSGLLEEMQKGDGEAKLYAGLLACKLTTDNADLMKEFGKRIVQLREGSDAPT